jgi:hypothetical protein
LTDAITISLIWPEVELGAAAELVLAAALLDVLVLDVLADGFDELPQPAMISAPQPASAARAVPLRPRRDRPESSLCIVESAPPAVPGPPASALQPRTEQRSP